MKTTPTKKLFACLLSFGLLVSLPARACAWGREGHRIVARIAQRLLTQDARDRVDTLLNDQPLSSVALFADDIRGDRDSAERPETKLWHFVDIPIKNAQGNANFDYLEARDCPRTRYGDCVVEALTQFQEILIDESKREYEFSEAEALKFIVHFVGDLHQPLHCADNNDRGGNRVLVQFFQTNTNLHSLWDTGIIRQAMSTTQGAGTEASYANRLFNELTTQEKNQALPTTAAPSIIARATIIEWAKESHRVAINSSYRNIPANGILAPQYFTDNRPVVDKQLKMAGIRLAKILNEAFK